MPGLPVACACASPIPTAMKSATSRATPCQMVKRARLARADAEWLEHSEIGAVRDHTGEYPGMVSDRSQRPITHTSKPTSDT